MNNNICYPCDKPFSGTVCPFCGARTAGLSGAPALTEGPLQGDLAEFYAANAPAPRLTARELLAHADREQDRRTAPAAPAVGDTVRTAAGRTGTVVHRYDATVVVQLDHTKRVARFAAGDVTVVR